LADTAGLSQITDTSHQMAAKLVKDPPQPKTKDGYTLAHQPVKKMSKGQKRRFRSAEETMEMYVAHMMAKGTWPDYLRFASYFLSVCLMVACTIIAIVLSKSFCQIRQVYCAMCWVMTLLLIECVTEPAGWALLGALEWIVFQKRDLEGV